MQRDLLIATALALAASACNGATVDPSELTAPDGRCTDGARSSTDLRSADRAVPPDGAAPPSGPENLAARADLLILTHASLAPAFEPLAAWKRARGLPVQVVTTAEAAEGRTGADEAARLRSYISWSHQSRGTR
ncbi:MAG: hypothetical protein FJ098_04530, partial [Deltaproteobacteria bacterium]|nr:hypothetical protein [Deltaproteobacteria bacterium]